MNLFKAFVKTLSLVAALTGLFLSPLAPVENAWGKDLTGRLGIGFINSFGSASITDIPSVSAKYALTKDLAVLGCVGLNTLDPTGYTLCAKVFKNVFYETHLNFYVAGGFAFMKRESRNGIEGQGVFGTEIFIPGVDSLGLSFEAGLAATNITGSFHLKTIGYTFLHAGVHFYF